MSALTDRLEQQFHKIKRLPPYLFAEVNAMKAAARQAGEDIIDFGMGNPDQPTPTHIVEKLREAALNPRAHRYSTSKGIPGLRRAISAYYERRFNVAIDPESEAIVTLGSKEGLANQLPDPPVRRDHRRRIAAAPAGRRWLRLHDRTAPRRAA